MTRYRCTSCRSIMETVDREAPIPACCPRCGGGPTELARFRLRAPRRPAKVAIILVVLVSEVLAFALISVPRRVPDFDDTQERFIDANNPVFVSQKDGFSARFPKAPEPVEWLEGTPLARTTYESYLELPTGPASAEFDREAYVILVSNLPQPILSSGAIRTYLGRYLSTKIRAALGQVRLLHEASYVGVQQGCLEYEYEFTPIGTDQSLCVRAVYILDGNTGYEAKFMCPSSLRESSLARYRAFVSSFELRSSPHPRLSRRTSELLTWASAVLAGGIAVALLLWSREPRRPMPVWRRLLAVATKVGLTLVVLLGLAAFCLILEPLAPADWALTARHAVYTGLGVLVWVIGIWAIVVIWEQSFDYFGRRDDGQVSLVRQSEPDQTVPR